MNTVSSSEFDELVRRCRVRPRLRCSLKFTRSTQGIDWSEYELVAVWGKAEHGGVLLTERSGELMATAFELSLGITSSTGRQSAIVCDLCATWQRGAHTATMTLPLDTSGTHTVSYLVCADLLCSQHVRDQTSASQLSRAQLRETMTPQQRIERLRRHIDTKIHAIT